MTLLDMSATAEVAGGAGLSAGGIAVAVGLVVLALLVTFVAVLLWNARPWELQGVPLADRWRIGDAVNRYDFWLSVRGVGARQRRERRTELRANLWEAARRVGVKQAVAALGPLRALAKGSVAERGGPRWGFGLFAGLLMLELVVAEQVLLTTVVADTAHASGVAGVRVPVGLFPGMAVVYERLPAGRGFSVVVELGPVPFVLAALAFVVFSRPWRLLRRTGPGR